MVDVFTSGTEGYPCYRIPSLLRLPGLLLLFAEGRFGGDVGSRTDIVYKASKDEGRTWSPLILLYSEWEPPGHSWHSYTKNATFNTTRTYWARDGWLDYRTPSPVGLPTQNLTLANAEAQCANHTQCFGFEFFAHSSTPSATAVLIVTFRVESRFNPDRGNIVTLHNPAPVASGGRALVVFARNQGALFSMRALDDGATQWGAATQLTDAAGAPVGVGAVPGPPGGIVFPVKRSPDRTLTSGEDRTLTSGEDRTLTSGEDRTLMEGTLSPVERIAIAIGSRALGGGAALLSDNGGETWRVSGLANPHGGEAQIALAPNGSLLLNSRGPTQGVRWQSVSDDGGESWTAPRVLDFGFGSSCEGSLMRVPQSQRLLFSHAGRIGDRYNRWNLTIWSSSDSGATWTAVEQVRRRAHEMHSEPRHPHPPTHTHLPTPTY